MESSAPPKFPRLVAIVAMTPRRVIGRDGAMPWHLPADLAFFKRSTSGHPVVMGRKTYESIGRPLPRRRNIVLTRDPAWRAKGVETIHRPEDLARTPELPATVFVIGGAKVYEAFLPWTDELLVSHLRDEHEGDTWFPDPEPGFRVVETVEEHPDFVVRRWRRVDA